MFVVTIHEDDLASGTRIDELNLEEDDAYILLVHNGKELIPPTKDFTLQPGHSLIIISKDERFLAKIKGATT